MARSCKPSQGTAKQAHAVSGNADSQAEFIAADEFKAHLAANGDDNEDEDDVNNPQADVDEVAPKKKKKPKVKRPKPTGFEEYHADAPLTPGEYAEEQELYDRYFDLGNGAF
jgi:Argonaute siRNA chaperone (ARC) complex subunit Arb1